MNKLQQQIEELATYLPQKDQKNEAVSRSTVGWQLDHILRVIVGIAQEIKKSKPEDYHWKFNFKRLVILGSGYIPRGNAKAPKVVRSEKDIFEASEIESLINKAKEEIQSLPALPAKANFEHPYFGLLTKKQTIRFLEVHTNHHLKIIRDIL